MRPPTWHTSATSWRAGRLLDGGPRPLAISSAPLTSWGGEVQRWVLVPILIAMALAAALLDRDAGLFELVDLRSDRLEARARVDSLRREVRRLERESQDLVADPVALERALREDLGMARSGEIVVRWPVSSRGNTRIP